MASVTGVPFLSPYSTATVPSPTTLPLFVTLDELYRGTVRTVSISESVVLNVNVQPGVQHGWSIPVNHSCPSSVIAFKIFQLNHRFVRQGDNLFYQWKVSATQARFGCEIDMLCIDGSNCVIRSTEFQVSSNPIIGRLQGKGMPIYGAPGRFGDLIIEMLIVPDESQPVANHRSPQTCDYCCEEYQQHETDYLPCCHSFHRPCIDNWLSRDRTCPQCRHPCWNALLISFVHCSCDF